MSQPKAITSTQNPSSSSSSHPQLLDMDAPLHWLCPVSCYLLHSISIISLLRALISFHSILPPQVNNINIILIHIIYCNSSFLLCVSSIDFITIIHSRQQICDLSCQFHMCLQQKKIAKNGSIKRMCYSILLFKN